MTDAALLQRDERREALRREYRAFLRDGRVLLTGHSHQAWPDVARDAGARAFDDAATHVDDKWGDAVFPIIERVGARVLGRLGFDATDAIAFGSNTHELVFRLLSAFPTNARVVTTLGEFHSLHRQLARSAESGLEVTWVDSHPRATLAERIAATVRQTRPHLLAISAVFFEDSFVLDGLAELVASAIALGTTVLVDAYHAFNVVPLTWPKELCASPSLFVTAGGYKYAQMGEGVCFLRVPPGTELRPVFTGWFADFASLEAPRSLHAVTGKPAPVAYGKGASRFAGATFDPVSFYRADLVLDVFDRHGLDVATLRAESIRQTSRIVEALAEGASPDVLTLHSSPDSSRRGGFVAVRLSSADHAHRVVAGLREHGVFVDARGDILRVGPAPYLTDDEIDRGVSLLCSEAAAQRR